MENDTKGQSIISVEMEITGTIKTSGSVQLDGKLNGDLNADGNTVVGKTASVKGNLAINNASVLGSVTGNITARDRIELKASTRMTGDIKARRLVVEEGVTYTGKVEVNPASGPAGAPPIAPPPAQEPAKDDKSFFRR